MRTALQQEVLLMTGTSFSSRQCLQKNDDDNQKNITESDQLQEACWNGQLWEMLPEICNPIADSKALYLWQIRQNRSCVEIIIGESPVEIEEHFSLDPYSFLAVKILS